MLAAMCQPLHASDRLQVGANTISSFSERRMTKSSSRKSLEKKANQNPAFLFDLDGTLMDSVYQHVLAWREALEAAGIELSVWRIHRRIGMSGGLFVNALLRETGHQLTREEATQLQRLHAEAYGRLVSQVRPLPGARELLAYLSDAKVPWAIATSGRMESAGPALEILGVDLAKNYCDHKRPRPVCETKSGSFPGGRRSVGRGYRFVDCGRRQRLGPAGGKARHRSWRRAAFRRLRQGRTGKGGRLSRLP